MRKDQEPPEWGETDSIVEEVGEAELDEDKPPDDDLERPRRELVRRRRRSPHRPEEVADVEEEHPGDDGRDIGEEKGDRVRVEDSEV